MIDVRLTTTFVVWRAGLRDREALAKIAARLTRLARGNPGDVRPVGEGVSELCIKHGAGYRLYFKAFGPVIVVILCGGDKSSQNADIRRAKRNGEGFAGAAMEKLTAFDAADFLSDRETQQLYLEEFLADGDTREILDALGVIARAQNMSQIARETGITRVGLLKALGPGGNPSFDTVNRLAKALGMNVWFKTVGQAPTRSSAKRGGSSKTSAPPAKTRTRKRA